MLFVPGSILTLGAGFVFANAFGLGWGVLLATVAVFCGAVAGDLTAFLLGRYLLRDWVMGWTDKYKLFKAIDKGEPTLIIMGLLSTKSEPNAMQCVKHLISLLLIHVPKTFRLYFWSQLLKQMVLGS